MPTKNNARRHVIVRKELNSRVEQRLARVQALAQRTRMLIARLDRELVKSRSLSTIIDRPSS
jgi:hypothetical protein